MTASVRSRAALAGTWMLALAAGVASHVEPPAAPQQPAFRAGVSGVAVDVSVRDRSRRPIMNLQASDFEVLDNGVPQNVDSVSYGKLPIDVTVALDVSYSVTGMLLEQLRRGVVQLMRDLTRQDRLKLILFNMRVNRTVDFTADVEVVERAIRGATAGGSTALLDAISVALVSASAPDRRQLIVFFTDGSDSTSVTAPAALTPVAQRTRATVTFVMPAPPATLARPSGSATTIRSTSGNRSARPPGPDPLLSALAAETGGSVLPVGGSTDLSEAFRRVLNDFRSAYVLYYNARGVDRDGYHAIDVKVKREGATVQARRGYWH